MVQAPHRARGRPSAVNLKGIRPRRGPKARTVHPARLFIYLFFFFFFFWFTVWGVTLQQQPGSYQGGEMMMMKSVFWWRKREFIGL